MIVAAYRPVPAIRFADVLPPEYGMQTNFTAEQLRDPDTASSNAVLRTCVHCGMCTATCPTFLLLGDELDSPRGRIYLIKDMLETGRPATEEVVRHVDRCLSCLSCMTTCPSGVNYMHLVDHARAYIEQTYRRPLPERLLRRHWDGCCRGPGCSAWPLPAPGWPARSARLIPGQSMLAQRLRAMLSLAPAVVPAASPIEKPQVYPAEGARKARVALLTGCAQQVLMPRINEATIRLLTRLGVEVVVSPRARAVAARSTITSGSTTGRWRWPGRISRHGRGEAESGCGGHQCLRLRHHGQGLRVHVPHRTGTVARTGRKDRGIGGGHNRVPVALRLCCRRGRHPA